MLVLHSPPKKNKKAMRINIERREKMSNRTVGIDGRLMIDVAGTKSRVNRRKAVITRHTFPWAKLSSTAVTWRMDKIIRRNGIDV